MPIHKRDKSKTSKSVCLICKGKTCVDEKAPKILCRIHPKVYSGRVTRSMTKILNYINDFVIIEEYRCMPLLGDEENVPNWEVHIVRYAIVFLGKK